MYPHSFSFTVLELQEEWPRAEGNQDYDVAILFQAGGQFLCMQRPMRTGEEITEWTTAPQYVIAYKAVYMAS